MSYKEVIRLIFERERKTPQFSLTDSRTTDNTSIVSHRTTDTDRSKDARTESLLCFGRIYANKFLENSCGSKRKLRKKLKLFRICKKRYKKNLKNTNPKYIKKDVQCA